MSLNIPIAITIGDPAGVGAEIIQSWAEENPTLRKRACVIAHKYFLDSLPNDIGKIQVGNSNYRANAGIPDEEGANIAFLALEEAAKGCIQNRYTSVVTAPISKECMKKVGFDFQGQTEFFADRWNGSAVMCFAGEKFIVSLVTWHDALKDVSSLLNEEKIARAVDASAMLACKLRDIENPRIAV